MSFDLHAELDDEEIREYLEKIFNNIDEVKKNSAAVAGIVSSIVFRDVMSHFDQESGPEGTWAGWSQVYSEHMNKIGRGGNKILQDTGRLRQAFTPTNYRPADGGIIFYNPAMTPDGFPYAAAHDEGGGKLPQRQFMWLSDIAGEEMAEQLLAWVADVRG